MPKVSIIIPIFNTKDFLSKSISSCLNQSFEDIEIILVDDKSTDGSLQIAQSFLYDKRVKLICNSVNSGTFLARKIGVEVANGEYIIFLDADDYLREDAIGRLQAIANGYDIIHFGLIHKPKPRFVSTPKVFTHEIIGDEITKTIFIDNFKTSWFIVCTRMYRASLVKKAISKLDFVDRHLISSEDTILFFVICLLARKSIGINEDFYIYCQNDNSIMRIKDEDRLKKQIDDRIYLQSVFHRLEDDMELRKNRYFLPAQRNMIRLLMYFVYFSKRFLPKSKNCLMSPYLKYSLLSFKVMPRWQILVKTLIYLLSFGTKKM